LKQRRDWFARQLEFDPSRLVFIDETGASTNLSRKSGRCRRGRRFAPPFHTAITRRSRSSPACAFAASWRRRLSIGRSTPLRSRTGSSNASFPHSREATSSLWIISRSHKEPRVEQLIKAAGAELRYLPPYSPDMNPIEKAYSKLKAFLRKIAERSVAGLMRALEACADIFKPAECENYFKACGYDTD
jgi:hypothetical protein